MKLCSRMTSTPGDSTMKMRRARQKVEEQQLLSSQESKDILDTLNSSRNDYTSNNEYTHAQIRGLTSQIDSLKEQLEHASQLTPSTQPHTNNGQQYYTNDKGETCAYTEEQNREAIYDKVDTKNMITLQDDVKDALADSRRTINEITIKFNKINKEKNKRTKTNKHV